MRRREPQALGFTDLTDGMYEGDPTRPYEQAQARIGLLAPWVPLAHSQISFVALSQVTGIAIGANGQIRYEKVERK